MGPLIVGYGISCAFLALTLLATRRVHQVIDRADDDQLRSMRQTYASGWTLVYPAAVSVMSLAGAVALVARGHAIGVGWLGVSVVWMLTCAAGGRTRRVVLDVLGDRGRVVRSSRNERRLGTARQWALVGVAAYVTVRIIGYAYPEPMPDGAGVVQAVIGVVVVIAGVCWLALRLKVYLALDDDKQAARDQDPT